MSWTRQFKKLYAILLNTTLVNILDTWNHNTLTLHLQLYNLTTCRDKIHKSIVIKVHQCCSPCHTSILHTSLECKTTNSNINHGTFVGKWTWSNHMIMSYRMALWWTILVRFSHCNQRLWQIILEKTDFNTFQWTQ